MYISYFLINKFTLFLHQRHNVQILCAIRLFQMTALLLQFQIDCKKLQHQQKLFFLFIHTWILK